MKYYFLAASLPDLQIGYPPDLSFHAFAQLIRLNLLTSDYAIVAKVRRFFDIQNIREFWRKSPIDERGNYDVNALEDALITRMGLPEYVYSYMESYPSNEERLAHFPQLVSAYFREEMEGASPFVKQLLQFEREWRLVLTGFRAKKLGRDLAVELQYEDPHDEIIAQMLAQKDSASFEPPTRYEDLKGLFEEHSNDPMALHKALCEYRFAKIESFYGVDVFSLDRIICYMVQLIIVEKWMELDRKAGLEIVDSLIKEAS